MSSFEDQPTVPTSAAAAEVPVLLAKLRSAVERAERDGLTAATFQDMMTAQIQMYFLAFEQGQRFEPVRGHSELSSTAILTMVCMLMRSADVGLFDLGLWQSWSGIR
jgi:hypothetical protein